MSDLSSWLFQRLAERASRGPREPVGVAARYVDPAPGFPYPVEARFIDLALVPGGPTLLLAQQVQADGGLRRAYSHSGFVCQLNQEPGTYRPGPSEPPVTGPTPLPRDTWLLPFASDSSELRQARALWDRVVAEGGPGLELVRRWAAPARRRSAGEWGARRPERSAAEEAPYVRELLRWLRELVPSSWTSEGGVVWDPACHYGHPLLSLAATYPGLRCVVGDLDPRWPEATERLLSEAGHEVVALPAAPAEQQDPGAQPVDLLLLRALNRGVMEVDEARASLRRCVRYVRTGGLVALWGYSAPLLNATDLEPFGELLCRSLRLEGGPLHTRGPAPFYLLRACSRQDGEE